MYSAKDVPVNRNGLSHSEISGLYVCLPLPEAYRSLPRPSSATNAKASAIYPYYLDTFTYITTKLYLCTSSTRYYVKEPDLYLKDLNLYNQSFIPNNSSLELTGIEPATSSLQS